MAEPKDNPLPIEMFCCLNPACKDFGQRHPGNLVFRGHTNQQRTIRKVHCLTCHKRVSERKGTPLYRSKLAPEKVVSIAEHLAEGVGCLATARLVKVDKDTVGRYVKKLGDHAQGMHDLLVPNLPHTQEIQYDEKWAFVGKKQGRLTEEEKELGELGNRWDHVAQDAESKLNIAVIPGDRNHENSKRLIQEVKRRTGGREDILHTSDEYEGYPKGIAEIYGKRRRKYKREIHAPSAINNLQPDLFEMDSLENPLHEYYKLPPKLVYATVRKTRENGVIIRVRRKLVFGFMSILVLMLAKSRVSNKINTSYIERLNGTDRQRNARKKRKAYTFSKKKTNHDALTYFVAYSYNFCWQVRTLRELQPDGQYQQRTPAMVAGLTNHTWTMQAWVTRPVAL